MELRWNDLNNLQRDYSLADGIVNFVSDLLRSTGRTATEQKFSTHFGSIFHCGECGTLVFFTFCLYQPFQGPQAIKHILCSALLVYARSDTLPHLTTLASVPGSPPSCTMILHVTFEPPFEMWRESLVHFHT